MFSCIMPAHCVSSQVSVAESSGLEASFVQHVLEGCLDCVCVKKKGRTLTMFRWVLHPTIDVTHTNG